MGTRARQRRRSASSPAAAAWSAYTPQLVSRASNPSWAPAATDSMPNPSRPATLAPLGDTAEATATSMPSGE